MRTKKSRQIDIEFFHHRHRGAEREASFRHLSIHQKINIRGNATPFKPIHHSWGYMYGRDMNYLRHLYGNTEDLKQYWKRLQFLRECLRRDRVEIKNRKALTPSGPQPKIQQS